MTLLFRIFFIEVTWVDLVDIGLVTILLYQVYKMIRGSLAVNIFLGILALYLIYLVDRAAQIERLHEIPLLPTQHRRAGNGSVPSFAVDRLLGILCGLIGTEKMWGKGLQGDQITCFRLMPQTRIILISYFYKQPAFGEYNAGVSRRGECADGRKRP